MQPHTKKKILFLITKSNWGGAQRYVYDLSITLPQDRFKVAVALGGDGPLLKNLQKASIDTVQIPGLQRDISLKKEVQSFKYIWKIIANERPEVLHVNSSKAGGLGAFAGRCLGVPKIVYSAHGWAFNEDRGFLSRLVVGFFHWLTVMLAHQTIAVSNATKAQMKWPFTQRKITVVHNGRPTPQFLDQTSARQKCIALCPQLATFAGDLWTGTIAELHPVKCHELMIEAVAKLTTPENPIRHIIMGDGEQRPALEKMLKDKGLEENIFFLGHVDEADRLLKALDIFTLTSRSEALGYSVIEAAQAGLSIIATKVGGIPEIITDKWDGILISPNDAEALLSNLKLLTAEPDLRAKIAAAAKVRGQHFSLERMVVDTSTVYNR